MIARGGRAFVGASALLASVALPFNYSTSIALAGLTLFLAFVFRDPKRTIGQGVVAAADGTVRDVNHEKGFVSTYLALRNVHVTRAPIEGVVTKKSRERGRHLPAFSKDSAHNERLEIGLRTSFGEISIVQMTGAIARRIVPYIEEGQTLEKGEKLGLIRFGSRVDVYMPPSSVRITVQKGDKLRAGVTRIAEVENGSLD